LQLQGIALREPGKLVVYRQAGEFAKVRQRMAPDGVEQLLDEAACQRIEPALQASGVRLAGGVFTPGEAVADCHALCLRLAERLREHPDFVALHTGEAMGFRRSASGALQALRTREGEFAADHFVLAAGLGSRALAAGLGVKLPLYPLKGYSLTAPIGPAHRPPEVSVTDFERKILYARMDDRLRVAAMVDLVGEDLSLDPQRLAGLQRAVRQMFPQAADFDAAESWGRVASGHAGGHAHPGRHADFQPVAERRPWRARLHLCLRLGAHRRGAGRRSGQPPAAGWAQTSGMTTLAERLRDAVQAQRFETLPDALRGGAPLDAYPSLDLALCCFDGDRPQALNLLFSREHPQGLVGAIAPGHGALGNIGFVADVQDGSGASVAWQPGADWQTLRFAPLAGRGTRFVAPYPALAAQADDRHRRRGLGAGHRRRLDPRGRVAAPARLAARHAVA
jgi:hypothetical protein